MAKKKIETITSLGRSDNLIVQKSLPLFALWQSELTLAEFKILDTYLARIDSHHPEKRQVIFEKGELEEKLGVKKINQKELEERLKHLMGNVLKIPDKDGKKGFQLITLFEEALVQQDDFGLWQVKLECTQKSMKYIFNIDSIGYLRYKLRCITSLTSRYTYIMFVYLESNRYRKSWEVSLDELREILACDKEETYKVYKRFNDLILKKIYKEMHEKTECRYTYEPIKKGRSVVAIRFELETLKDVVDDNMTLDVCKESESLCKDLLDTAFDKLSLNECQLAEIKGYIWNIPSDKLPSGFIEGNRDIQQYHYALNKVNELIRRDAEKPIKNKYNYLLKMIKNDFE